MTFAALAGPGWEQTRGRAQGTVLIVGDTTEADFGIPRGVAGPGSPGDGGGRVFLQHNGLVVDRATGTSWIWRDRSYAAAGLAPRTRTRTRLRSGEGRSRKSGDD